jgi:hypothetical protein
MFFGGYAACFQPFELHAGRTGAEIAAAEDAAARAVCLADVEDALDGVIVVVLTQQERAALREASANIRDLSLALDTAAGGHYACAVVSEMLRWTRRARDVLKQAMLA